MNAKRFSLFLWIQWSLMGFLTFFQSVSAGEYSIDNTCKACSRRYLDSLNVYDRRPIRVNQVGFRPQDPKKAFVADPSSKTFKVVSLETGAEAWSGALVSQGTIVRPGIWVNGAFNSISSVYQFGDSSVATLGNEELYAADFSSLSTPGIYAVVVDQDTSASFRIDDEIFNHIFENSLMFFGSNRCGDTHSWMHKACHLKDGSDVGHDLTGGWHDCGDHFKVSSTIGYASLVLSLTYVLWPEKAEDFFGASYNDTLPFGTDGIPDLLWEAKIGADYIFKLYKASKADGLLDQNDMYHSVGVDMSDHQYWDVPEHQDAQLPVRGGPDRVVATGIGGNVAGMYTASLALFAWGWELYDQAYSDSLLAAAREMYTKLVVPNFGKNTDNLEGFYTGGGFMRDDPAMAALALWFVTKDNTYRYDLLENTALGTVPTAQYNDGEFPAGWLGRNPFHHGGWTTDYQNVSSFVLYAFAKLILPTDAKAAEYGVSAVDRDSLLEDAVACLRASVAIGSNGAHTVTTSGGGEISVDLPYGGVFTSVDWGYNRYNMGMVNELFMMWDLTGEIEYLNYGLDNLYYNLGMNPWDVSFLMGTGDRNLQHPHNRAANPDGYNAGGFPYEYKCPRGALMGGSHPSKLLKDDWNDYTVTETCIDFSAQWVLPSQMLAKDLPPDHEGPVFSNVLGTPISDVSAVISWETNELAQVTVYLAETAGGPIIDTLVQKGLAKAGAVQADGLVLGQTYYFYLKGQDNRRNVSTDDNHGAWYSFEMKYNPATISNVRICQVDDQSAKIYWWTHNGAFPGSLLYGTSTAALNQTYVADNGQPVMFHEALLTNLLPGTTYYFDVVSGTSRDSAAGGHYSFTTSADPVFVDYTITIKPTKKKDPSAHFYIEVMNNEARPYVGLELRFYFSTQTVDPSTVNVQGFDNSIFDAGGTYHSSTPAFGSPVELVGTGQWYIPITIQDTFPVAGRARIEMEMHVNGWDDLPWSELVNSWSLIPHLDPLEPVAFKGVDLSRGQVYTGPDQIETVNGVSEITYVRDPYISAHFNGNHIYGYPPDYASGNMPVMIRDMYLLFQSPFQSPQTNLETEEFSAQFVGNSWVKPTGDLDLLELNGNSLASAVTYPTPGRTDSLVFDHSVGNLNYGSNRFEFVSWHNADANIQGNYDCQCVYQRSNIEVDTVTVPKEKRLVVFDPADTIQFYQGKRKLVHVYLTDSLGQMVTGEDISLTVGAIDPYVMFFSDATSPATVNRVTFNNGVAEFYVGYEDSLDQILYTALKFVPEDPLSEFLYIVKNPVVVVEPPPPWPIIEKAYMLDTDCNYIPDRIVVDLTGNFASAQYEFTELRWVYQQDTLRSNIASINDSQLIVDFVSPKGTIYTNPRGQVYMDVNVLGVGVKTSEEAYQDSVAPTVLSVSMLENVTGSVQDSLFVQFSEPVSAGVQWMFNIYDEFQQPVLDTPAVVSAGIVNESKNIWAYVITSPLGGKASLREGMYLQLKLDAALQDRNGNAASVCANPLLQIRIKRRPVPLKYASISDEDHDGLAERVTLQFARAVDALHNPDSVMVVFGYFEPETLWTTHYTWSEDLTLAILQLPRPFALGNTAGTYTGVYAGNALVNAGLVAQYKGSGADFEINQIEAEDLTGPVISRAEYSEGALFDTLMVYLSEPVSVLNEATVKDLILRKRGGVVPLEMDHWVFNPEGTELTIFYQSSNQGAVTEGDEVRLEGVLNVLSDNAGNFPIEENPWAVVSGNRVVKIVVERTNISDLTQVDVHQIDYGNYPVQIGENFRMTVKDPNTGSLSIFQNGVPWLTGIDTNQYDFIGPAYELSIYIPRGSGYLEDPVWDSVRVQVEYTVFTNLGGYVNDYTESVLLTDASLLDAGGHMTLQVEWLAQSGIGPVSASGRAAGNGAYIGDLVVTTQIFTLREGVDREVKERYNYKSSHSEHWLFGFLRGVPASTP